MAGSTRRSRTAGRRARGATTAELSSSTLRRIGSYRRQPDLAEAREAQTRCYPVEFDGRASSSRARAAGRRTKQGWSGCSLRRPAASPSATRCATSGTSTTSRSSRSTTSGMTRRQLGFADPKIYVVQTNTKVIERCMLMTTDPGDLVLDPTCGSGTTAYVAEQWGRRWITIDTSPGRARARSDPADVRPLPVLPARRLARGSGEGGRADRRRRRPANGHAATSARGSSTSACRTSR